MQTVYPDMKQIRKRRVVFGILAMVVGVAYYFALPSTLFDDPYSTVLEDRSGELLSATIAKDGQWRFPEIDSVPEKFGEALILFEDKRFRSHPGVDVGSLARAIRQNWNTGKIVSGGSTISMQVIRLSRKNRPRTYFEKVIEIFQATRLEFRYTKDEILALYASHAPFGGNVVGLEAACWRYFGRDVHELSWAEAALLAVLPNSPALIHPGKNRVALKNKRDRLLDRLHREGVIDDFTLVLAKEEDIPDEPMPLPRFARHLLQRIQQDGFSQQRVVSTIDRSLQQHVEQLVQDHHQHLTGNQIYNAATLVLDVQSGEVMAYVGNTKVDEPGYHGEEVDIIAAPRSTGSILKPFLFAAMLDEGKILPNTLLPDVPTVINGFAPKNFSHQFDGAVPAGKALIRSLNVPAVYMLQQYRYEKFHSLLKDLGMTTLNRLPDHYGLSLILGGSEGNLWDITGMYASMARTLNNYFKRPVESRYDNNDFHPPHYRVDESAKHGANGNRIVLCAASIYQTLDVLKEVYRPGEESGWRNFFSSKKIAWKTGTSFGFRDGWAVGVTPQYAVGVWVGNADGEGRPGLTGTETAAPLMFDIFSQLTGSSWFQEPYLEMDQVAVCSKSGMRLSAFCEQADTIWVATKGLDTRACIYHKRIHVTSDQAYRVNLDCEEPTELAQVSWFVLPAVQEHYFKPKNAFYKTLPPLKSGCETTQTLTAMELVYPKPNARILIPRELDGAPGRSVFELAHRNHSTPVYWHLDGEYLGITLKMHKMEVFPRAGKHTLTVVDGQGDILERQFEVVAN
jgi:penicillin-binding protein 1C